MEQNFAMVKGWPLFEFFQARVSSSHPTCAFINTTRILVAGVEIEKKRKEETMHMQDYAYASQVQLRALRKGPLNSKLARA
eukprot:1161164-Pelagomonas_calceolata.AAC.1